MYLNIINEEMQKLAEVEALTEIVDGSIRMGEVDNEFNLKLINLCNNRLNEVNEKIEETYRMIAKAQEIFEKNKSKK